MPLDHASACDRAKFGSLRHHFQPTACTIHERLGFITEVLGVATVEENGQVHLGPGPPFRRGIAHPTRPSAAVSSCTPDKRMDIQSASRSGPIRSPANQLRSAASISASLCRQPSGPRFSPSSSHTGGTGGIVGPSASPVVMDCGFTRLCPQSGWQIVQFHFHRAGQEPHVVLRRLF